MGQNNGVIPPSVPAGFSTGLEWIVWPADEIDADFDARWAAFDLADVCRLFKARIVRTGERVLAIYPPALEPELIAYVGSLLVEAQPYLVAHLDKLPALPPAEAVKIIMAIAREHRGLRFTRGDDGSMWPHYPKTWTAGQVATVQGLWFAADDAFDYGAFR